MAVNFAYRQDRHFVMACVASQADGAVSSATEQHLPHVVSVVSDDAPVSGLQVLQCVTSTVTRCSDVTYIAHFEFDSIVTSSSDKESVEDCVSQGANNLVVLADGFLQ